MCNSMVDRSLRTICGLLRSFQTGEVSAQDFSDEYLDIWRMDGERERAQSDPQREAQFHRLVESLQAGAISGDDFHEACRELHGWSKEESTLLDEIDALHSAASGYTTDPVLLASKPGVYVTEVELREHAARVLALVCAYLDEHTVPAQ